jgi:hypothetical protein
VVFCCIAHLKGMLGCSVEALLCFIHMLVVVI